MIRFRDFRPQLLQPRGLLTNAEYETLAEAAATAARWADESAVDVVSIETVVLPSIPEDADTAAALLRIKPSQIQGWYQFIRVWYRSAE